LKNKRIKPESYNHASDIPRINSENNRSVEIRERPDITVGTTERFKTGCGSLYIHVNHDERGLIEVFLNLRGGGCPAQSESIGRLVSLCLRCNVGPSEIIRRLRGIRCPATFSSRAKGEQTDALSCPDAVARAISKSIDDRQKSTSERKLLNEFPECDKGTEHAEGQLQIWQSLGDK